MKVKKISSKLIKPLTPTPPNLKNYKISFLDSRQLPKNMGFLLFYESKPESYRRLGESLAQTLVQFFPLAGRFIKENKSIDCSDQGAEFVEAEALGGVDLVSKIGTEQHNELLPDHYFQIHESVTLPLLSVQATRFACGGMTLAVSISHRVFDASSLSTFIAAWSSNATNPDKRVGTITPSSFDLPSLLPMKDGDPINTHSSTINSFTGDEVSVKKLHFDGAAIAKLKSKIGKPASRARVVCAVIAKALIRLDAAQRGGRSRGFRIFQPLNMRERTITPVPKHACGNFSFLSLSRRVAASEVESMGLPELVDLIGEAIERSIGEYGEVGCGDRDGRQIILNTVEKVGEALRDPETNVMFFSDLSKFGLYEADFGWGKPVWIRDGPQPPGTDNFVVLTRNKEGDGIEVWFYVNRDTRALLQSRCGIYRSSSL